MKTVSLVTDEEVTQWLAECGAGMHPLSKSGKAAMERSREQLLQWFDELHNNQQAFAE